MEFDSFVRPIWQLPIHAAERTGNAYVPATAKYHCFVDNSSLCGKYHQDIGSYDEGITVESGAVACSPDIACKHCLALWKKKYCPDYESPNDF